MNNTYDMLPSNESFRSVAIPLAPRRGPVLWARLLTFVVLLLGSTVTAYGQTDPWSTAAGQLSTAFTGPIAKGFALVAIVIGGLELAFSEGGGRRTIGALIFGVGLALGAATFLSWITT